MLALTLWRLPPEALRSPVHTSVAFRRSRDPGRPRPPYRYHRPNLGATEDMACASPVALLAEDGELTTSPHYVLLSLGIPDSENGLLCLEPKPAPYPWGCGKPPTLTAPRNLKAQKSASLPESPRQANIPASLVDAGVAFLPPS